MALTEEQIQEIQAQLMKKYVDDPLDQEAEIEDTAEKVTTDIMNQGLSKFEFQNTAYEAKASFKYAGNRHLVFLVITNVLRYRIAGTKYVPYTATAEVDTRYSYSDNLKAVVTAFLKHLAGIIEPEPLDDDDDF